MPYPLLHILHLLSAILFIGVVFFEIVLLEGIRRHLGEALMEAVETGLINRARRVMPWVVGLLFLTGGAMFWHHATAAGLSWTDSFTVLLTLKVLLALSVLVHFVTALRAQATGCMSSTRFRNTHLSVGAHMLAIVVLAKAMFYVSW